MNTHLKCPTCKVNHPCGIQTCPNYAKTKITIKENQEKFQHMHKKGKGEKKQDKKPEEQLPKGDGVPEFVAVDGDTPPLKDTQQLGRELFESFSKNLAGICQWIAKTAEIEELSYSPPPLMSSDSESDCESEDVEHIEDEEYSSTVPNITFVARNTRQCALLHLLAWVLATALHLLNTACIEIVNWDSVRHLLFIVLLLVTASICLTSVVWVAAGALLASCKHGCHITRKDIRELLGGSLIYRALTYNVFLRIYRGRLISCRPPYIQRTFYVC
eukprot:1050598-Rhodomonas_salina.1